MKVHHLRLDLDTLQTDQAPWVLKNFGKRPAHQPLLGIVEELGELNEAMAGPAPNPAGVEDALADIVIFMADFCTSVGFRLADLYSEAETTAHPEHYPFLSGPPPARSGYMKHAGRLCHAYLKREQGIRGTPEQHDQAMKDALVAILVEARCDARANGLNLIESAWKVWSHVRERVWRCERPGCGKGISVQGSHYCSAVCEGLVEPA